MEYVNEITCAILEEAACVASHRNSMEIEASDVNLVLAKKFAIEIPGAPRIKTLHKYAHKLSWPTLTMGTSVHDTANKVAAQEKEVATSVATAGTKKSGTAQKRKIEEVESSGANDSEHES